MTVPFDHRIDGTAAAEWTPLIDVLPAGADVGPHDHLAVVVAHPDDETLGAGGLIAGAAAAGAQITVVVVTDGDRSHPRSTTHSPERLAQLRRAEVTAAVRRLAPEARIVLLGRPDGGLVRDEDGLRAAVADAVSGATVVASTWRDDGHPDHEACGRAAATVAADAGARLVEFPIWGLHWGRPGHTGPLRGDGWVARALPPSAAKAKADALAEHRSQHQPLSPRAGDEPVLSPAMLEHFARPAEVFRVAPARDLPAGYFERLYTADPDPWRTAGRFYEQRKRDLLLAVLPRPRFAAAFEPGCGAGLVTEQLARRCSRLVAMDASAAAAAITEQRCGASVEVRVGTVPADWPDGRFDLVVISELGYYLADPARLARCAQAALTDDGVLVACHWRRPAPGYPTSAEQVHAALGRGLHRLAHHVEADFVLDVWSPDPRSVADREGIVDAAGDGTA